MNPFLYHTPVLNPPWHVKYTPAGKFVIVDHTGHPRAQGTKLQQGESGDEYRNTAQCMAHAPQLLAALKEAVFRLHELGDPVNPNLIELIRHSGQPNYDPVPEPRKWNNATQSLDNE